MARVAITRGVSASFANCELTHLARVPIDVDAARAQHRAYERALEDARGGGKLALVAVRTEELERERPDLGLDPVRPQRGQNAVAIVDLDHIGLPAVDVAGVRRGVLEVEVDSAVLLQELAHFHKRRLLRELRGRLPDTPLNDLRFRNGAWEK